MILVVLFFVVLTSAALLNSYGPNIKAPSIGDAAASLLGLLIFFFLVSACLIPRLTPSSQEHVFTRLCL